MKKFFIIIFLAIGLLVIWPKSVFAQEISNVTVLLNFQEEMTEVHYAALLSNTASDKAVTSLKLSFPISFKTLSIQLAGQDLPLKQEGQDIIIDLSQRRIEPQKNAQIEITAMTEALLAKVDGFRRIYIPGFNLLNTDQEYELKVQIPKAWGAVSYSSENYNYSKISDTTDQLALITNHAQLFSFGNLSGAEVNAEWKLIKEEQNVQVQVPIPASPLTGFVFTAQENTDKAARDFEYNEFLTITSKQGYMQKGSYHGYIYPLKGEIHFLNEANLWSKGSDKFEVNKSSKAADIYQKIIEKFSPQKQLEDYQRLSIEKILEKPAQNSLDYAFTLAALLRQQGSESQVVYGIVNFPVTNQNRWHFWVISRPNNKAEWQQSDPFLEDLTGFSFFEKINPERIAWGSAGNVENIADLGFQYLNSPDTLIKFISPEIQVKKEIEVTLNETDKIYSGLNLPVQLTIRNNGNTSVYLNEVQLENVILKAEEVTKFLIIPNSVAVIPVEGAVIRNPLTSGEYILRGKLKANIQGVAEDVKFEKLVAVEVDHRRLLTNAAAIFVIIFTGYYLIRFYRRRKKNG